MANETSFEKVMNACLEAKKTPTAKKAIKESVKKTAKNTAVKNTAKKISESKKAVKTKRVNESEEEEIDDIPAIPDVDEIEVDDIDIIEEPVEDTMDDVADDIMVVVDPELDAEDIDSIASELQDIIDDTPEDEVPTTDEYVGDFTYGCPICGTTFFSGGEMGDGDECPVCGNTPNGFVLVGQVASTAKEEEVPMDDEIVDFEEEIPVEDDEELVADVEDETSEDEEEIADLESLRRARKVANRKAESRKAMARRNAMRNSTSKKNVAERKALARKAISCQLDESTFNPFMTKFIRENYKNAKSYRMTGATLYKDTKTLKIECVVTMNSGAKKKSVLKVENFNPNSRVMLAKDVSRTFKAESKTAPFRFTIRKVGNSIKCEGMRYNYITKSLKEGKRLQVTGNLIRESKTVNRNAHNRAFENRARAVRNARGRFSK